MTNVERLDFILNKSNNLFIKKANIELEFFHYGLLSIMNRKKHAHLASSKLSGVENFTVAYNAICEYIPVFQRSNDKWSTQKQISFIFNLLKGQVDTPIIVADILENNSRVLLDGVQRVTSIHNFFNNPDMTFDLGNNEYISSDEICTNKSLSRWLHIALNINVITFNTEVEAVQYYIDMNEGSTHSENDILRAKEYLKLITKNIE